MVRCCWVNFQCRDVLVTWLIVGQGPTALAEGAGVGCLDIFTLIYLFSLFSPSLWETARNRLKYCLKGPLNPKHTTNQPDEWQHGRMVQNKSWLVGCLRLNGPLRQYFNIYRAVSKRGRKNVQTTPTPYCKRNRPLPYYNPN